MKNTILNIISQSEDDYNKLVFDAFVCWCIAHNYNDNHLQLLLTSNKLYNWFMAEYGKCEKQFLFQVKPYIGKVPVKDIRALYDDKTAQILFYPQAILLQIMEASMKITTKPENAKLTAAYNPN